MVEVYYNSGTVYRHISAVGREEFPSAFAYEDPVAFL